MQRRGFKRETTIMHYHAIAARDSYGARPDGTSACDGVYWDGSAWRVCLHDHLPSCNGGRSLEPIETAYHSGEDGCRRALTDWIAGRQQ